MAYSMEHKGEALRLERQNQQQNYNIMHEIRNFNFLPNAKVLDAGCGAGDVHLTLLSKYKHLAVEAFDFSEIRLQQAKKRAHSMGLDNIRYFQSDIYQISAPSEQYDYVICRFVLEHLNNPLQALQELKRVLKVGGYLYIIDLDGILFNIQSKSAQLNDYLTMLRGNFDFDLHIGRKLPGYLAQLAFQQIETTIDCMYFSGQDLEIEKENFVERFNFAKDKFISALGSQSRNQDFVKLYIDELAKGAPLIYNKFLVAGRKL